MRRFLLALAFALFGFSAVHAEVDDLKSPEKPAAPSALTQEQFDTLVKSVTDAVTKSLQSQNAKPGAASALATHDDERNSVVRHLAAMVERAPAIVAALPAMLTALERLPVRLDRSAMGGLGFPGFMAALIAALAAAWAAEMLVRAVTAPISRRIAAKIPQPGGLKSLVALTLVDGLRIAAVAAVVHLVMAIWFAASSFQATVMALALECWLRWRIFTFFTDITLRPSLPDARIAPISDGAAQKLASWIILTTAVVSLTRFFAGLFSAPAVLAAALMLNTIVVTAVYILFLTALRGPLSEWFAGLVQSEKRGAGLKRALARNWLALAIPLLLFLAATRFFGALTANVALPAASATTLSVILGFIVFETLMVYIARRPVDPNGTAGQIRPFALRAAQVIAILSAILFISHVWAVSGLSLIEAEEWHQFVDSWRTIGLILLSAFFAWEAVRFIGARYGAHTVDALSNEDSVSAPAGATRLQTLMPPFRVAMAAAIIITTLLMVLSSLGINTTPLIAGASVFGLAISFGSQTLVKDIVSGIFFLADDAFRVGEYIDCKSVKGTVEGFTLRSIKLRHQNGQIHTIPFGQLGQITNFSRDWSTVKFNLRFARDTDVDALRKATKKLGQELAQDPELKDQFIAPLKLQGVADIDDTALIMRFKFTVKPINPAFIQRVAVKRMLVDFPAQGLKFASQPGIILQTPYPFDVTQPITSAERPQTEQEATEKAALAVKNG